MKPQFATPYNQHMHDRRHKFGTKITDESMTVQADPLETDINVIVQNYTKTGRLPNVNLTPLTGDFTEVEDFRGMQERLLQAREEFAKIPAAIRKRFNHDPQEFIDFALNPENADEMVKLGLAEKKTPPQNHETFQEQEEYTDDGPRYRTRNTRSENERHADADRRAGDRQADLRQREELRSHGDREPRTGGRGGEGRKGSD